MAGMQKRMLIIRSAPMDVLKDSLRYSGANYADYMIDVLTGKGTEQHLVAEGVLINNIYTYSAKTVSVKKLRDEAINVIKQNNYDIVMILAYENSFQNYLNVLEVAFAISRSNVIVFNKSGHLIRVSTELFRKEKLIHLRNCFSLLSLLPLYIKYLFLRSFIKEDYQ